MNRKVQWALAAALGIITSILTAALLSTIELRWNHALYSFTVWFVIPVGAIGTGMVAACGYLAGARLLNCRPGRDLLGVILASSAGMFFLIQWFDYLFMTVDGRSIQEQLSFSDFLAYTIAHTSLQFGVRGHFSGGGVDIGSGGYLFAAVQIVGFLIGGFAIYGYLTSMTYCEDCKRYLSNKGSQSRYFSSSELMQSATEDVLAEMQSGRLQHSVLVHAATGSTTSTNAIFSSSIEVKRCKGCDKHWVKFAAQRKAGNEWKAIDGLVFSAFCFDPIELQSAISAPKTRTT